MKLTLQKDKIKILLLEGPDLKANHVFEENGYTNIERLKGAVEEDELLEKIKDAHIVGIRSRTQLNEKALSNAPKLVAIGCFCIGTNQVDLHAAKLAGIPVFNAPFSNTRSVAELVLAETIMLMRDVPRKNSLAHEGVWAKSASDSFEARGKTLGIVGYGRIGAQVGILAESIGMKVCYYDLEDKLSFSNAENCRKMETVLVKADVLTLHVPSTNRTRGMIGANELAKLRQGACLINASRGDVVDTDALVKSLESGHLGGAAVDVFPEEPASNKESFTSELQKFDNVILTPHIGGSTQEAQVNIAREVAEKLIKYSDNGSTTGAVNFAEVSLPARKKMSRFLHIHMNRPGVLEEVNSLLSAKGFNIASQYLQTDNEIGYLICDVDGKLDLDMQKELRAISGAIRTRVLYEPK